MRGPGDGQGPLGVPAIALRELPPGERKAATGMVAAARKSVGKVVDTVRLASWVRRHEVVIVLRYVRAVRPGRMFGTKVAPSPAGQPAVTGGAR